MKLALVLSALISMSPSCCPAAWAQAPTPPPQSPFAGLIAEYLRRDANGHSPTPGEIAAMATLQPQPDASSIWEAMPYLLKALDNPDAALHAFALSAIAGLQSTAADVARPAAQLSYKDDVARALTSGIPKISEHLTSEESTENRLLVATILGGFTPHPPAAVYPPLLDYLKRDDGTGPVGVAVVGDLLQIAPLTTDTTSAIIRYVRRSDQTSDSRSSLIDMIASTTNQSQAVNKALLLYLDSDDDSVRARVILSLPQLDLAPEVLADTRAQIDRIVNDSNENLQVVTAAKSIAACWTAVRMTAGCPVY